MTTPALRATVASAITYRHTWRGSAFSSVATPVLYLAAMGGGLGRLVDHGGRAASIGGVRYLTFLAPGLLAAAAMQTAAGEGSYPVMAGIKWRKSYQAMLATPLDATDVALGHVAWLTVRVTMTAVIFLAVMVLFGAAQSAWVVAAVPAAVLTGLAYGTPITAYTATLVREYGLSNMFRFGIVPMFLFSGTFFPVTQLPAAIRPVAYVVPLWHGVRLCRTLALGDATLLGSLGHVAYLSAWAGAGTWLAVRSLRRRLVT